MESLSGRSDKLAEGYIAIGRISSPWGIRGEVKVTLHTDFPQRFLSLDQVYLGPEAQAVRLLGCRPHQGQMLLLLEGYADRSAAEVLRGLWVQVPLGDAMPLPEDEHYVFELVGLHVQTTDGQDLGQVAEVLFTGSNEVLVVEGPQGQVLIPYIKDVVVQEDFQAGRLTIQVMPGLLD